MKKRIISILLILAMAISICPLTAFAKEPIAVVFGMMDGFVYEGGIFDVRVHVSGKNAEKATYRWQADASMGDGSWFDLEDNQNWRGTKTEHLQMYTNAGILYGTGWEKIPFRCLVTVDGEEYASPDVFIQVLPKSMLFQYLKQENEGFEDPIGVGIGGYHEILSTNQDGYASRVTAYAGEKLGFAINYTNPSAEFFTNPYRSEVSFIPEIRITENGKLVESGSDICYYCPDTVGTTLTVEHILRVKAGETDHGVYQSNMMTIDVIAPESYGVGTVKQDCSLLKEMYNESQKLCSIPKGSTVQLIANIGGTWCKALYGNRIGYIPTTSLNIEKKITNVSVLMDQPWAGELAPFWAKADGKGYHVSDMGWWDMEDNRYLKQGDLLKADRIYRASVWLEAEDGYEFEVDEGNEPNLKAVFNGLDAMITGAFEKDPRTVVVVSTEFAPTVSATHICTPALIPRVEPSCTTEGMEAYYHCDCGRNYSDAQASERYEPKVLPMLTHKASAWKYNGTHHYRKCEYCLEVIAGTTAAHSGTSKCTVCGYAMHTCSPKLVGMVDPTCVSDGFEKYYRCDCGKTYKDKKAEQPVDLNEWGLIPKLPHVPGNWKYNGTHHYRKCEYCLAVIAGTTAPHSGSPCSVCGYLNPNAQKKITSVNISDVSSPLAGMKPDYSVSMSGAGCDVNPNAETYEEMYRGISWYDITDMTYISKDETFKAGHEYQIYLSLRPDDGYVFEYPDVTINGKNAESFGGEYYVTVCYTFAPCPSRGTEISSGTRPFRPN